MGREKKTSRSSSAPPAQQKQASNEPKSTDTECIHGSSNNTISPALSKGKKKTQTATFNSAASDAIVDAALECLAAQTSSKNNNSAH